MMPPEDARHLDSDGLRQYLLAGVHSVVPISGSPPVFLVIDPEHSRISVRTPTAEDTVLPMAFRRISTRVIVADDERWAECAIDGDDVLLDAYPVLLAVIDRIQLDGLTFNDAVADVISSYRRLLQSLGRLNDQEEVGLTGELLLLRRLVDQLGDHQAVLSWRGAEDEEHDFDIGGTDIEVKTTTSERRRHWVSTLTQLVPTGDRPLWVLSIQLTTAGSEGMTLSQLIQHLRTVIGSGSARLELERRLAARRWDDGQADLYIRRFRLRNPPAGFLVDTSFPAITPATLHSAGLPLERIVRVTYQIDLTGLSAGMNPPAALASFLSEGATQGD